MRHWMGWLLVSASALAGEKNYQVSTAGSSAKVKLGEKGVCALEIRPGPGAHVSDEAPLRIELAATGLALQQQKLTGKDSKGEKAKGQEYANPRFEVPFSGVAKGAGSVQAKVNFFLCTEKLCERQQEMVTLPVEVN